MAIFLSDLIYTSLMWILSDFVLYNGSSFLKYLINNRDSSSFQSCCALGFAFLHQLSKVFFRWYFSHNRFKCVTGIVIDQLINFFVFLVDHCNDIVITFQNFSIYE